MHGLLCLRCGHHLRSGGGRAGLALAGGGGIGGRTNALCCAALSLHCRRCWVANARPSSGPPRVSSPRPHWWCAVCSTAVRWNHPRAQARGEARHRTVLTSSTQKARRRLGSALPTSTGYRPAARARLASLGRAGHCRRRPPSSPSVCTWYCLAPPCGLRLDRLRCCWLRGLGGGASESNRRLGCGLGRRHGRVVVRCLPALLACLSPPGLLVGEAAGGGWGEIGVGGGGGLRVSAVKGVEVSRFRLRAHGATQGSGWWWMRCCCWVGGVVARLLGARVPGHATAGVAAGAGWSFQPPARAPIRRPPVAQPTAGGFAVLPAAARRELASHHHDQHAAEAGLLGRAAAHQGAHPEPEGTAAGTTQRTTRAAGVRSSAMHVGRSPRVVAETFDRVLDFTVCLLPSTATYFARPAVRTPLQNPSKDRETCLGCCRKLLRRGPDAGNVDAETELKPVGPPALSPMR